MANVLLIYEYKTGGMDADIQSVHTMSDFDLLIQEECKETVSFGDNLKKIDFYIQTLDQDSPKGFVHAKSVEF